MSTLTEATCAVRTRSLRVDIRRLDQLSLKETPPEIFFPTFRRIRWEMSVLRKAGKDPATVSARVADRVLNRERSKIK